MKNLSPLGIVLAGGTGSRLHPCTFAVNKQLLPVYDKPLIFYPLSVLMLNDVRQIVIICNPDTEDGYKALLGNGSDFGCEFIYRTQQSAEGIPQAFTICEDLIGTSGAYLILGDNIFHGSDIVRKVKVDDFDLAKIYTKPVKNPQSFGVVQRDSNGQVIDLIEKPQDFISKEAALGLYYFPKSVCQLAKNLVKSERGEFEITDLIRHFLNDNKLIVSQLGRGTAWFDTGTSDSLLSAANYVQTLQNEQGYQIANLEEIALSKKWIDRDSLMQRCSKMGSSSYNIYLKAILD